MVKEQILSETLVRHYSDAGKKVRQIETDIVYDEAVDVVPCRYTYVETEDDVSEADVSGDEVVNVLFGGGN